MSGQGQTPKGPRYVTVAYHHATIVEVDLEEGTVTGARVLLDSGDPIAGGQVIDADGMSVSEECEERAVRVADSAEWPKHLDTE